MSRLDELINELCPCGVEYINIGSVVNYEQPSKYIVKSTNYSDDFLTPVLTAGQSFILGYTNEKDNLYSASKENPVIIFDDFTGAFKWVDFLFKVKSSAMKMLTANADKTTLRYIYHTMRNIGYSSVEHKRLWISMYSEIKIPLPPLPVQHEIVRILDTFTELTTELTSELTAELEARKKQYEYYSNKLMTFFDDIQWNLLGDVTRIFSASRVHKNEWTTSGIPFFRTSDVISIFNGVENSRGKAFISNELYEALSSKSGTIQKNDILITGGGTIGIPYIVPSDEPLYFKDADLLCIQKSKPLNSKFLYHYFMTTKFRLYLGNITHNATIAHYTISQIANTPVPIPSLEEQERIVAILDRFDSLCNNLTSTLAIEIESRRKQYEYYSDKLLTFQEV